MRSPADWNGDFQMDRRNLMRNVRSFLGVLIGSVLAVSILCPSQTASAGDDQRIAALSQRLERDFAAYQSLQNDSRHGQSYYNKKKAIKKRTQHAILKLKEFCKKESPNCICRIYDKGHDHDKGHDYDVDRDYDYRYVAMSF